MKRLIILFLGGTLMAEVTLPDRFHVQAHRGACSEFQENTLPSFESAIESGADTVEFDVHMTKDGVLVLHHDFEIDPAHASYEDGKPLEKRVAIRDLTLAEIKKIRIKDTRRIKVPHALSKEEMRLPTLSEMLALHRNSNHPHAKKIILDFEIKSDPDHPEWTPEPKMMAKAVLDQIGKEWDFKRSIVRSFDHRVLKEARKLNNELTIAALTDKGFTEFERVVKELKPAILAPEKNSMTKEQVLAVQKLGVKVVPFTANTKEDWDRMISLGMDGVTTDDPKGLIRYLESKSLRAKSLNEFKKATGCYPMGKI